MRTATLIAAGTVASWALAAGTFGRAVAVELLLGMAAPLGIAIATMVLVERTYGRDPGGVTQAMIKAFIAKMVLVGAYVALVLGALSVRPAPFIASFTIYFIALYAVEYLCLRRLMGIAG